MVALFICSSIAVLACIFLWMAKETGRLESQEEIGKLKAEKEAQDKELKSVLDDLVYDRVRIDNLAAELVKIKSQKKSSEVRTGLIAEQMAPFLEGFPYNPKNAVFLGRPLDFVVFDEDGVHFVEVKSGKAQLSSKQRRIRDHLRDKKVTFEVYHIKGE